MANYSYPIDLEWSHEEMNKVIKLWNAVEEAYEKGIQVEAFKKAYQEFKTVVRSIGEEKRLGREFEKAFIVWSKQVKTQQKLFVWKD